MIQKGDTVLVVTDDWILLWKEEVVRIRSNALAITDKGTVLRREVTPDGYVVCPGKTMRYYLPTKEVEKKINYAIMKQRVGVMLEKLNEKDFTLEELVDFYDRNKKFV